jgi:hypothetical protein
VKVKTTRSQCVCMRVHATEFYQSFPSNSTPSFQHPNHQSKMTLQTSIDFVSLGMVVLDEIRIPHRARLVDVVGGSGAFGTATHLSEIGITH